MIYSFNLKSKNMLNNWKPFGLKTKYSIITYLWRELKRYNFINGLQICVSRFNINSYIKFFNVFQYKLLLIFNVSCSVTMFIVYFLNYWNLIGEAFSLWVFRPCLLSLNGKLHEAELLLPLAFILLFCAPEDSDRLKVHSGSV